MAIRIFSTYQTEIKTEKDAEAIIKSVKNDYSIILNDGNKNVLIIENVSYDNYLFNGEELNKAEATKKLFENREFYNEMLLK